ncbi:site-specific recombinase, phage integrase family [Leptospira yanagawae serovar Saopaulo str. Sao Paulo = ATCC 700523]|uniref:Site-specific integrase n=2 Tax=Leptospira yanagawae TaxID=293069 RepID=A0ABY2M7Y8_9LEPT|nr:tyrosine-type recombinase/integrase [Leptospira yanagawae]EOQ89370.1 site-specific recombinase, phage integrase family [Leptospira yanagawae serovar Saopaulo str. Sao Paulo = ATCC 700523]TGL23913.1 site-specific integrase [Leptospira yanagawae]
MLNTNLNLPTFLPPILTVDVFTLGNRLLAQTEILNLLNRLRNKNHFHYLIIKFLVCTGLSLPELIHLKIADFNKEMDRFYITNVGRLRKRHIFLDPKFAVELYRYSCEFSPGDYLFPGRDGELRTRTIQKILKTASRMISREIHIPFLRDVIALDLFQKGFPLREIQEFLGHRTKRSTRHRIMLHITEMDHRDPRLFTRNRNQAA